MFAAQAKPDPLQPPQRSEPDGSGDDAQRDLSAAEAKPDDRDIPQRGGRRYAGNEVVAAQDRAAADEADPGQNAERSLLRSITAKGSDVLPLTGSNMLV